MDSFNVYGQTSETIGGNTPVWLGTVKPIPVGAKIANLGRYVGRVISAGTAVQYNYVDGEVTIIEAADGLNNANAYMYNDLHVDKSMVKDDELVPDAAATCAVVMHHPEGLLIERVYPVITEEQIQTLQAKIPGVLLVRG